MQHVQQLASAAPNNFNEVKTVDWNGVAVVLRAVGVSPSDVAAATWCQVGHMNIEALVDSPQLVLLHPRGIVATVGKKKLLGGGYKFDTIDFSQVRNFGPTEYQDERGFGKYCIELAGAAGILLGRLQWTWRGKRFKNNTTEIVAVAEERDRVLSLARGLLS